MNFKKISVFILPCFFVNTLLYSQNDTSKKYSNHPITAFNINLGVNYTGATKGSLAPGYTAGIDFEHHFKSSPFGLNLGFRNLVLTAKQQSELRFFIAEFFGKISYRISKDPTYINAGYSSGRIYNHEGFFPGLVTQVHFANLGFEHKFFIPEKLMVSAGVNYKLTNIYDQKYGNLHIVELVFKIGKR